MTSIRLSRRLLVFMLSSIVTLLSMAHISMLWVYYKVNDPRVFDFVDMVDFDIEGNLPTLYSTLAIMLAVVFLFLIWRSVKSSGNRDHRFWLGLLVIFFLLGMDESVSIHEEIGDFFEAIVPAEGFLYFAWVVPYSVLLLGFVILYFRFLWRLPQQIRWGFILAGGVFVCGALGFEIMSAHEADLNGTKTLTYSVLYTIEELLEMIGIILFINYLLHYLHSQKPSITLDFSD